MIFKLLRGNKMRITAAFAFLLLLGACAAAPEAENKSVKEMDNAIKEASYMPVHKKVIIGGKTLIAKMPVMSKNLCPKKCG